LRLITRFAGTQLTLAFSCGELSPARLECRARLKTNADQL